MKSWRICVEKKISVQLKTIVKAYKITCKKASFDDIEFHVKIRYQNSKMIALLLKIVTLLSSWNRTTKIFIIVAIAQISNKPHRKTS